MNLMNTKSKRMKLFVTVLCIFMLLSVTVGSTLAYLFTDSQKVTNTFEAAKVSCSVDDEYAIINTGTIPAYIRAAVVVNWISTTDGSVWGMAPVEGTDYTIASNDGWSDAADGYFYYDADVAVDAKTTPVCTVAFSQSVELPSGYGWSVEVLGEAIQAEGVMDGTTTTARQDAWQ